MEDISESLQTLGFTQNEIDIYSYLYKNGVAEGPDIYKAISTDKSSFYRAVGNLKEKGLIAALGETRNQKFKIADQKKIFEIYRKKQIEIRETGKNLKKFLASVSDYTKSRYTAKNIQILEGKNAYYLFREELLKGRNYIIRDLIPNSDYTFKMAQGRENYHEDTETFIARRIARKIGFHILYDKTANLDRIDFTDKTDPAFLKEARQFPFELSIGCSLDTFGDKSAFLNYKNGNLWILIIKDRIITDLLNSLFDVLWSQSTLIKL
jgi:sugar-specific transcriptional regulator TrmB